MFWVEQIHGPEQIRCYTSTAAADKHLDTVCTDIQNDLGRVHLTPHIPNLPGRLRTALRSLRSNPALVVTKADKGDAVVLLGVTRYTELAWRDLSNDRTYTLLSEDPTQSITRDFNRYLKHSLTDRAINAGVFDCLKIPEDADTQVIYFLPKIHKDPLRVRPIVSSSGGPTSRVSGYLDTLLQPHAVSPESYIKNSSDIICYLQHLEVPESSLLASLDIESLYTNISHKMAITSFTKRFSSHPKCVFLLDLLKFVLYNNTFHFDGKYFRQICGIPMGTKLAPNPTCPKGGFFHPSPKLLTCP